MRQQEFLAKLDRNRIVDAIGAAEKMTSGEIRVHIQPRSYGEIRVVAEKTFERLGMTKTAARNGVLLFIACEEQNFVILGDSGIDARVPANFWNDIASNLNHRFRHGEFTDGIVDAIHSAGVELRTYFPRKDDDVNELTNEINVEH